MEQGAGEERKFYVYYLRRPDKTDPLEPEKGQPFYVGKGNNCRYLEHRKEAEKLKNKPGWKIVKIRLIHKLWKQGLDFTEDIILDNLSEDEAFEIEQEAIKVYGRINLGNGCLANMTNGGDGCSGFVYTEEYKQRIKNGLKGKHPLLGKKMPDWWKEKLSQGHLGEKHSKERCEKNSELRKGKPPSWAINGIPQETKDKISKTLMGRFVGEKNPFFGKKHTKENKENNSQKVKKLWKNEEWRKNQIEKMKGRKHSIETKKKMSISQTKRHKNDPNL